MLYKEATQNKHDSTRNTHTLPRILTSTKKINGKKVISKLSMPVSFTKGEQNPIKLKKNVEKLGKAMGKLV